MQQQQEKKKRTRASHPKVRTGCHTCKARRVKCDEQRPSCQKCVNTGRKCEGYQNTREWVIVVAPPTAPPTDGFEDDRSRRHFDYFRNQAVYELSWFFEGSCWGTLVLKQCHSSAAVRHAVIALSCSHEDFKDNLTVAAKAPQYAFAAQHYSKSIKSLIKETSRDAQESRMKALICGLLFISIEILRGNNDAALHHLNGCLKIVREAQSKMGLPGIPNDLHPLEHDRPEPEARLSDDIIPAFARLDVQASMVLGQKLQGERLVPIVWDPSKHVHIEEVPLTDLQTVLQACNSLLLIANRIHNFMRFNSDVYRHQLVRPIPVDILAQKMILYNQLLQWESAIAPLLNSHLYSHDYEKLKLMRIHNRTGLTLLESSLHVEECLLDQYQWAFQDIVNYTAQLQDRGSSSDDESEANESDGSGTPASSCRGSFSSTHSLGVPQPTIRTRKSRPFFLLDNGVIFSLYWTALKARDGVIRRRAISLLEFSTQEGVWVGPIQAAIAKRVIEIEEQQPYEQYPPLQRMKRASDIPEYIRVHSVSTDIDKLRRRSKVSVLQRIGGMQGEWRERVEWVYW